jgi:hypothetical protein
MCSIPRIRGICGHDIIFSEFICGKCKVSCVAGRQLQTWQKVTSVHMSNCFIKCCVVYLSLLRRSIVGQRGFHFLHIPQCHTISENVMQAFRSLTACFHLQYWAPQWFHLKRDFSLCNLNWPWITVKCYVNCSLYMWSRLTCEIPK